MSVLVVSRDDAVAAILVEPSLEETADVLNAGEVAETAEQTGYGQRAEQ